MKKLLFIITFIVIATLSILVVSWYGVTATTASVGYQQQLENGDVKRLQQLIADHGNSQYRTLTLTERDLNLLLLYGIQKTHLPIASTVQLVDQRGVLRASFDSQQPFRRYINIAIHFSIEGKTINLDLGEIGNLSLSATNMQTLQALLTPYLRQQPRTEPIEAVWQNIETIKLSDQQATLFFIDNPVMKTQLQQQQLKFLLGKNALQRLPFYQQRLEQYYANQGRKRLSLSSAMQLLFDTAVQQNHPDPISENKAIILSLFLHTANHHNFGSLKLTELITLPQQPLRFSLEGRTDLANHLLATATITLFANSAIADTIGLYKELLDQQQASGFDIRDLIADHAGSSLATKLTNDEVQARYYQQRLAVIKSETELFPQTRRLAATLALQLLNNESDGQQMSNINSRISEHIKASAIYADATKIRP